MGLGVAVCGALVGLSAGLAWLPVVRLRRMSPLSSEAMERARRAPEAERPAIVAQGAAPGSWLSELCRELSETSDERLRVLAVNDALGEAEGAIESHGEWSRALIYTAFVAGVLGVMLAGRLGGLREWLLALPIALGGVAAAGLAHKTERRERERQRAVADQAVELLVGKLLEIEVELPAHRPRPGKNFGGRRTSQRK